MQFLEERYDTYIEKRFFEKLNDIEDRRYRESIKLSWLSDKMLYEDLTKKIEFEFTHYSLHDSSHSVSILQYIYMLLGKEIVDLFSVGDLWLLMEAAYSHDIGMSVNYEELLQIWKDRRKIEKIIEKISQCSDKEAMDIYNNIRNVIEGRKNSGNENSIDISPDWPLEFRRAITLINSEYIRQNHPERSKNKINDLISEREHLKIEERLYRVVGIIDHLHGTDFGEIEKLLDVLNTGFTTDKIHPRMIALLLRVGDVLDIRNNRFDYLNIKYLGHLPADSKVHFFKHKSVNNFLIDEETVKIHIDSDQFDVCSNSRAWLDYIELEMDHLIKYWKIYSYNLPPLKIKKVDLKVTYNKNIYITNILIESLSHLEKVNVPLSKGRKKHLILTGKNGCGKTKLLDAISKYMHSVVTYSNLSQQPSNLKKNLFCLEHDSKDKNKKNISSFEVKDRLRKNKIRNIQSGLKLDFNIESSLVYKDFQNGEFILAYYNANRLFRVDEVKNVKKINFNDYYLITEKPSLKFVEYLVNMKVTQALALEKNDIEKANRIEKWFKSFEDLLKKIFGEENLSLVFDEDTFKFNISIDNREIFNFNTLSSGYAALLDIIADIIMRMEKFTNKRFEYNMPGVVLIDEIEIHLHLEMQKKVMVILTTIFPNIQFIVSTHSPFVLNSIDNVVIYDLENHTLVKNGLTDIPYNGIVEGYFSVNSLSKELTEKFEEYKQLVQKEHIEIEDFAEIARLQIYLEKIPDYLALDISTEYQALKLAFERRSDLHD